MLPKTRSQEYEHRKRKRQWEARIILDAITPFLEKNAVSGNKRIDIFEFGSGDGFQIPYLQKFGNVLASDIYTSNGVKRLQSVRFIECSITDAPFRNDQFDLIFASQVIPDLFDITNALREARRIGKASCLYAFSVPTNIWLLLSVPALYYNKVRKGVQTYNIDSRLKKALRVLLPEGRARWNFIECYQHYTIRSWQRLFSAHGFLVLEVKPLLFYGPSEWPIIPTRVSSTNFSSSVLFLMMKHENQVARR